MNWSLTHAEDIVNRTVEIVHPYAETPITAADSLLCKGLDVLESKVPAVRMPPEEVSHFSGDLI